MSRELLRAAGILFLTPQNEALFLLRGGGSDYPGRWAWPGGRIEGDETPEQAAVRETIEEAGACPDGERVLLDRWTFMSEGEGGTLVEFSTFLQRVDAPFIPQLNFEHTSWQWAKLTKPPVPLHPGAERVLRIATMDELELARAMRDGAVISPQRIGNLTLFAIRITGTGMAYRASIDEYVWRDPSIYMNGDFLERCQGLPVILDHPEKAVLDTKEYGERVIGAVFLPYLVPDQNEVWAIVRVHDAAAARAIERGEFSTSPCVVLGEGSEKQPMGDGNTVLIEGRPWLLDHIAITTQSPGVWDKGQGYEGIKVGEASSRPLLTPEAQMPAFADAVLHAATLSLHAAALRLR